MKRTTLGAILIVLFGLLSVGAYKGIMYVLEGRQQVAGSDASSRQALKVRIGGDLFSFIR